MTLVHNWSEAHKFLSIQIALFWAAVSGLWAAMPAFQGVIPPIPFALGCIGISMALCIARLTHQSGVSDA